MISSACTDFLVCARDGEVLFFSAFHFCEHYDTSD
jgi:hypothetical protein